jgi:mono/diheme cytochrome c family protein
MNKICLALLLLGMWSGAAHALDREQRHGQALLESMCARCHAIGTTGKSPLAEAPPFRNFGEKLYDTDFVQRLQDGLTTMHPGMPTFRFERGDAEAAVNYLKAIQQRKRAK